MPKINSYSFRLHLTYKKRHKNILLSLSPVLFLAVMLLTAGCAPQEQLNSLDRRVNGLSVENSTQAREISDIKRQLDIIKQQQKTGGENNDLDTLRNSQADTAGRVEQIQAELMRLNGQIEQIAQSHAEQKKAFAEFKDENAAEIENLRQEVRLLNKSAKIGQKAENTQRRAEKGEVDLYQQALDLFRTKKYKEAKSILQKYIDADSGGRKVANAHFWMGECEYNMQRYEEAILEYQTVISKFPKSNKQPDALFKQGLSFEKLGDNESAKIVLSMLVKKYPSSPQAKIARKQLKHLK